MPASPSWEALGHCLRNNRFSVNSCWMNTRPGDVTCSRHRVITVIATVILSDRVEGCLSGQVDKKTAGSTCVWRSLLPATPPPSHPIPHTLALPAAYQPVPLGTETAVGAIGVDAVTPDAGCREVALINVCGGMGGRNLRSCLLTDLRLPRLPADPGVAHAPCPVLAEDGARPGDGWLVYG